MPEPILLLSLMLDQGGSERQLAEMALAMDRSRYVPHVGTFRAYGMRAEELAAGGVPVLDLAVRSFRSLGALQGARKLRAYIREHGIGLVHAFDAPLSVFATPVVRYFSSAAMLSSQRGHRNLTPEYRRLLRLTDSRVDAVVVNCQYLKRHLIEEEGVAEGLIELCYNGVDLKRFEGAAVRPAELEGAQAVIGTLCALRPEKGVEYLVEAFARLEPRARGWKLAVVGSGSRREALMQLAQELGVADCCVFQPATAEVTRWLRAMDVFVMPSLEEAFSNAIIEAMACDCAVVATNVGGNPELVPPERGLLVPPADAVSMAKAIETLLNDPVRRGAMAQAGREFVHQQLASTRAAARLADIYDAVLTKKRRR